MSGNNYTLLDPIELTKPILQEPIYKTNVRLKQTYNPNSLTASNLKFTPTPVTLEGGLNKALLEDAKREKALADNEAAASSGNKPNLNVTDVTPVEYTATPPLEKLLYGEWAKFALLGLNNIVNANKNYNLQKYSLAPLLPEVPLAKVSTPNTFVLNLLLQKLIGELNSLATMNPSSDLQLNLKIRKFYADEANKLIDKLNLITSEAWSEYNLRKDYLDNYKAKLDTLRAADNRNTIFSNHLRLLNNKVALNNTLNSNMNSFLNNLYGSISKVTNDRRDNDAAYQRGLNLMGYDADILDLNNKYSRYLNNDLTLYDAYKEFKSKAVDNGYWNSGTWALKANESADDYMNRLLLSDAPEILQWKDRFTNEYTEAMKLYLLGRIDAANRLLALQFLAPYITNGEGIYKKPAFYYRGLKWLPGRPQLSGLSIHKSGGKVSKRARLIDYIELSRKREETVTKATLSTNAQILKSLDKSLDNLSRENLLLLREIFK